MRDSIILPQSPSYQRHQKRKKERFTNHSGEPLYAQNPLILSHSSILLPASTKLRHAPLHSANCLRQFTSCRSRASPYESSQKHPFVSKLPTAVSASPRTAHCLRVYGINWKLPPVPLSIKDVGKYIGIFYIIFCDCIYFQRLPLPATTDFQAAHKSVPPA